MRALNKKVDSWIQKKDLQAVAEAIRGNMNSEDNLQGLLPEDESKFFEEDGTLKDS